LFPFTKGEKEMNIKPQGLISRVLKPAKVGTLVAALALSPVVYATSAKQADAIVMAIVVATPAVWFVRTMLFSREAH
jgi:hypothetical protein